MKIKIIGLGILYLLLIQSFAYAQNMSDYLILKSINDFLSDGKGQCGNGSGVIGGAGHFDEDHTVVSCNTGYYSLTQKMAVEITIEQHTGGDSDRWLLHEIERSFRRGNYEEDMVSARFRNIDGNNLFYGGLGGGHYRWLNNNVVVDISYTDLYKQKPEPIEVVKAYLAKFPSTIPNINIDNAHNIQWIKDEIDRRLWLCDKWNAQFQAGKATQADLIYNLVRNMKVFLNYRQKYFAVAADADLTLLSGYQQNNDLVTIQTKLSEYKGWWSANKAKSISLP